MVSTAKEMPQVGLVAPADWLPRHDFMEGCQGVMGPDPWSATKRAREKVLLIDGGQDLGDATLKDPVADARHPAWAQGLLARLRDGGPAHWRWLVSLRRPCAQRCGTPGYEPLREVVHSWALTPRCRVAWHVTEIAPQPFGVARMRQTGKTELGFLPRFRGDPFESRCHAWCVPLLA